MQSHIPASVTDRILATIHTLPEKLPEEILEQLISLVNELINTDFHALVQLLYRIDVDEKKLKQLLKEHEGVNAASIIAGLIIKRQVQKIAAKKRPGDREEPGHDDSW